MDGADNSEHRCGLCKKTFKQKSSLVRHAKKCTLDPTPSARQKACKNCTSAKSRCDLQRPACSRCEARGVPCAYVRPARTVGCREDASTVSPGSVPDANSRPGCERGLAGSQPGNLCAEAEAQAQAQAQAGAQAEAEAQAMTLVAADETVGAYLDCEGDFTSLSRPGRGAIHACGEAGLFPSGSAGAPDVMSRPEPGFEPVYPTSCGEDNTHTTPHAYGHHSAGSCAEGVDVRLDLDISNFEALADIHFAGSSVHTNATDVRDGFDPFSLCSQTKMVLTPTPYTEEIEAWMRALACKPVAPLSVLNHRAQIIFRAFRSWPRMMAKGIQVPPIIHLSQFYYDGGKEHGCVLEIPKHIARCITLCKMWVGQAEESGQIVQDAVRGEVESILTKYRSYDAITLLAALQSLMLLLVLLIFPCNRQQTLSHVPDHLFGAVQEMAAHVLTTGMLLHEEASHERPPWRIWTHIESKRRTLICIYLLHFAYSSCHGVRTFNCLELGRMRAPGPKWLWQAADEKRWMNLYTRWLAQWNGKEIIQAELFLVENGPVMDPRVEMWLEDADELSTLMMSIMNTPPREFSGAEMNPLDN
ncbi:hypothetical protein F5Y14DRAFT_447271 [Nemania sp. NC0429]|nr:hypothetical protein F5Y14DRAFT_447271 [Nemania sp. NC0429]